MIVDSAIYVVSRGWANVTGAFVSCYFFFLLMVSFTLPYVLSSGAQCRRSRLQVTDLRRLTSSRISPVWLPHIFFSFLYKRSPICISHNVTHTYATNVWRLIWTLLDLYFYDINTLHFLWEVDMSYRRVYSYGENSTLTLLKTTEAHYRYLHKSYASLGKRSFVWGTRGIKSLLVFSRESWGCIHFDI